MDVGTEAQRFDNPYLPDTRSELALPIIVRNEVLGAMTIQSDEVAAFSCEDITILQTMVDQLATAIGNARLFAESQSNLEDLQRLQQQYALDMWEGYVTTQEEVGYTYDLRDLAPVHFEQAGAPAELWNGEIVTRPGAEDGDGASMMVPAVASGSSQAGRPSWS